MAYTCFQAMRAGLLTRFWGSLGAAMGVASVIGSVLPVHLAVHRLPGPAFRRLDAEGPSPAWAEGKAIPWPTPGERAAESLQGEAVGGWR